MRKFRTFIYCCRRSLLSLAIDFDDMPKLRDFHFLLPLASRVVSLSKEG